MIVKYAVDGQNIRRYSEWIDIVEGSTGFVILEFTFSSDWDGLSKTIQLKQDDVTYNLLLPISRQVLLPSEIVAGQMDVAVLGTSGSSKIATTEAITQAIRANGVSFNSLAPPSEELYAQYVAEVEAVKTAAQASATAASGSAQTAATAAVAADNSADAAYTSELTATTKASEAAQSATDAATSAANPAYIGENEHWYIYNNSTHQYVDSGIKAYGDAIAVNRKTILHKVEKTTGWQAGLLSPAGVMTVAHNDAMSGLPITIDMLIALDPAEITPTSSEVMVINKPNSWCFKVMADGKMTFDINSNNAVWAGGIKSKHKLDFQLLKQISVESYGASQGVTTDGNYIYTTGKNVANGYHVMKRKLDGTLITGIILSGFDHPCDCCMAADKLVVIANNYPTDTDNHRIFIINTNDLSIEQTYDLTYTGTGDGWSGIAYYNGRFYCPDWQLTGGTNVYVYNRAFIQIGTFTLDATQIQGIDIAEDLIVASSWGESALIRYNLDTHARLSTHIYTASIEGEGCAITKDGTILLADVNDIWEYVFAFAKAGSGEHFERFTGIVTGDGTTLTYKLYRGPFLQATGTFAGATLQNATGYSLYIDGSYAGAKLCRFKLKALGISNTSLVPSADPREMFVGGRYNKMFVSGSVGSLTFADSVSSWTCAKGTGVYNQNTFEF